MTQIIAFGIGSALIGGLIVFIIALMIILELRREIERQKDRCDIERRTANSWFTRYEELKAKLAPFEAARNRRGPNGKFVAEAA